MALFVKRSLLLLAALQLLISTSVARAIASKGAEKDALPQIRRELKGCKGSTSSTRCKSNGMGMGMGMSTGKGKGKGNCKGSKGSNGSKSKFKNKPRIRREWRTLDAEKRKKVAE
jgi:hypothetical protein